MVFEGDFVVSEITGNSSNYTAGTTGTGGAACTTDASKTPCYDFFPFPAPSADSANQNAVQGAGDVGDDAQRHAAGEGVDPVPRRPRARQRSGQTPVASPHRTTRCRRARTRTRSRKADAAALVNASSFVFSLDDLQGSWEPMMWADLSTS